MSWRESMSYPPPPAVVDPVVSMRRRMLWLGGLLDQLQAEGLRLFDEDATRDEGRGLLQAVGRARRGSQQGFAALHLFGEDDPTQLLALWD